MARKICVVMDAPKPQIIEEPDEPVDRPTYLPPMKDDEEDQDDYDRIDERENELDALVSGFILDLIGTEDPEERDLERFYLQDEIELLKDEIEEVLANHGITIYRPTIMVDDDGNEVVVDSIYET